MTAGRRRTRLTRPPLSPLELEVMNVVWQLGDCTSAQVTSAFAKKRPLAPTTIRTVLANLRNKHYIKPIPAIGRGFTFRPTVPRESVARRSLRELLGSLFAGSPHQAIAYMLEDTDISESELDEIRRMIEVNRQRKGKQR
jgi:BlaI family penicillinase repressor